jgi:hypothetical protein
VLSDGDDGAGMVETQLHFFCATAFVGEAAEGVFKEAVHLSGGCGEGGIDVVGVAGGDEGAVVFGTDLEETARLDGSAVRGASVFAGEVYVNAREVGFESLEDVVDVGANGVGEIVVHGDGVVAVDLNLHGSLLLSSTW